MPEVSNAVRAADTIKEDIYRHLNVAWYKRMLTAPVDSKVLPIAMKVFAVLCVLGSIFGFVECAFAIVDLVELFASGNMKGMGISSTVVAFIRVFDLAFLAILFCVFGIKMFRNKRRFAAVVIYGIYLLLLIGAVCSLMFFGVSLRLVIYIVLFAVAVAFQLYLDPSLREERHLQRKLHDNVIREEQEEGMLGRDLSGKGYIQLNFFNLFWIFVIASLLGDGIETLFHVLVVDPGHMQDRAGLLFGPFSPIYGCGAVLMTIFLNRFYKKNILLIFLFSAIIGGAFEYFVSVFMQYTFGAVAWNYTGQFLSIGGRTCGLAMLAWGVLGVVWIKLLLPLMLWIVDLVPWNWRYGVTVVAAVFMLIDCVMSLQAYDCWYERLAKNPINTPIQEFYADHFDNTFMENRFQSMTVDPSNAVRNGKV